MRVKTGSLTPSPEVCVKCKGRLWCGPRCFILERFEKKQRAVNAVSGKDFQSLSPPGVFVSWYGYPKVNLSPMAPAVEEKDSWLVDDTDKWFGLEADRIISFRENLVRGNILVDVKQAPDPGYKLMEIQETLRAKKPVGVEMRLDGRPTSRSLSFSDFHAPMGPQAGLKSFVLTENPSVNPKIDKLVSDTDVKSLDAMTELYSSKVGVNQLHKILSAGMLGMKKARKFVPTRWSITALDSNLSEHFIDEKIKYYPHVSEFELFQSNYLENYFFILMIPRHWSFELMEAWKPGASWNLESLKPTFASDHEFFEGRKSYADNTAGGYYATRIAIAENLVARRRQATVLVFREIGDSGTPSLGVWKVRETVRDAMKKKPVKFSGLNLAFDYLKTKLTIPISHWVRNSSILDDFYHQKRITSYF